ncbi:hypothetical protein [Sediminibacterium ginsengisoli]|nr:hypothetical protein [Sediminibacterium ginsengisoli]
MEKKNTSQHILNTSATLFGLCYVVLTSLKALKLDGETTIDEFTAASMFLFMLSCLLSFLSMRAGKKQVLLEKLADYVFLTGLLVLFGTTLFIMFHVIA